MDVNKNEVKKQIKFKPVSKFKIVLLIIAFILFLTDMFLKNNPEAVEKFIAMGFYNYIYSVLSTVFAIFPFSVAEVFLIFILPMLFIFWLIMRIVQAKKNKNQKLAWLNIMLVFSSDIAAAFLIVYIVFVGTWSLNSYRMSFSHISRLDKDINITAEKLANAANILIDEVNADIEFIEFNKNGFAENPMNFKETADEISKLYNQAKVDYPCFDMAFGGKAVKPILLSKPYTYTFICGIFTSFTGEANINVNFPDFIIPHTIAHELAHSRRFIREDEANFIGFLVCMYSNEPFIRYSAASAALRYIANDLQKADKELYNETYSRLDDRFFDEGRAYGAFLDGYKSKVEEVSSAFNDAYLKSQGQSEGIFTYSLMVKWICAYYEGAK